MTDAPLLELDGVSVRFEKEDGGFFSEAETVKAVDDVSLTIGENDIVALVGESGCGKTTLGKTAIAAQRPTAGSVKYRGQDVWETRAGNGDHEYSWGEIRQSLQIIHQDPGASLNPHRRVMSVLEAPLKKWYPDLDSEDREARILAFLERVGMKPAADFATRYPHQLSGGEKQRVALVRALLINPDLILADEAISALDVSLRIEMMDLMHELKDEFNTSFLFISHDLSNARYFCEKVDGRIGVMYLGELVELGPAANIISEPQHPYSQVLTWATTSLDERHTDTRPPVRKIDIPDPVNPPSGCRFHTRCEEAREVCAAQKPERFAANGSESACFRVCDDDHEYWESPALTDDETRPSQDSTQLD
jgi:peptide/nickel transport system ATP-binding protein